MDPLLVSLFTGAIGALVAIFVTPWAQHFFWSLARRAESRFAAITEINNLWATFLDHAIITERGHGSQLANDFFVKLDATGAQITALFSSKDLDAFQKVQGMIGHSLKPGVAVHEFVAVRQRALADFYKSMGVTETSICRQGPDVAAKISLSTVIWQHSRSVVIFGVFSGGAAMARISVSQEKLCDFCRRHHIRRLAFFGSVLRDDFGPESDVDVLVEFEPGHTPGLSFFRMEDELSQILGRKVDLHTPQFLSRHFRDMVLAEAEVQYSSP